MLQKYIGTKTLFATPMTREHYCAYRGWDIPPEENPKDEGYLVEYIDSGAPNDPRHEGYISWSPKDVFDAHYRPVTGLTFGHALEALKIGKAVARDGWNGKGMFVYLVPANSYPAQTGVAKDHFGEGSKVPYNAYLALKGVDGTVSTWVPSINDTLAEDWNILD